MCTVSFVPVGHTNFMLISNRDESPNRDTLPPEIYSIKNVNVLFPKDAVAGGTWIGLSSRNRLICLLNGGFKTHEHGKTYRMSRGVFVTNLLIAENDFDEIDALQLNDIEPFTLIIINWKNELTLNEFVWDGTNKHMKDLPIKPKIWSSSQLYSEEIKEEREQWFTRFLNFEKVTYDNLMTFHHDAGEGNSDTNLIMNRFFVKTKSITGITKFDDKLKMHYEDLHSKKITACEL